MVSYTAKMVFHFAKKDRHYAGRTMTCERKLHLVNEGDQTYLPSIDSDDMGQKICTNGTCIPLSYKTIQIQIKH